MQPGCSLVITTRNRAGALEKLIPQLQQLEMGEIEIIVVDNASTDETRAAAQRFPGVKYMYFPGGLAEARHLGSMAATQPYISYVDDDCEPGHPRIYQEVARAFRENPDAGIVGSRIQNVGFRGMQQFKGYTRFSKNAMLEFEPNPPAADVFASMAITIRREVYHKIGGFDPAFSKGCEEVDLCLKVKSAGYKLIYEPEAFFFHYEMGSQFRFNPVHNRDFMRLYSFFKFFTPRNFRSWMEFLKNEWQLFLVDAANIVRQYTVPDYKSTHLPGLNKLLGKSPLLRKLLRWPLAAGAIMISPLLRRVFIPYIFWKATRRKKLETLRYGLNFA